MYRATSPDGPFTRVGAVKTSITANSYIDFDVQNGTTYYYQARPVLLDGSEGVVTSAIVATPSATSEAALKMLAIRNVLIAHPSTGQSPFLEAIGAFLQSNNIPMGFSPGMVKTSTGEVLGFYSPTDKAFFLSQRLFDRSVNVLAETMAHEGTHAWFDLEEAAAEAATLSTHPDLTLDDLHISRYPGDSIDQEYHAFMAGFRLWLAVDDGSSPSLTRLANNFLNLSEEEAKRTYVRPSYADQGLPEF